MDTIYRKLADLLDRGEEVALATIIEVKGSVPREVGAKMIIHPLGRHVGTVGGGCGEAEVIRAALDVIRSGQPTVVTVDLTEDVSLQSMGVCGGILRVFVERWPRLDGLDREALAALTHALDERQPVAWVTVIQAPPALADRLGRHTLVRPGIVGAGSPPIFTTELAPTMGGGSPIRTESARLGEQEASALADVQAALAARQHTIMRYATAAGTIALFIEVERRPPHLIIVGAGHIAQPLAQMGSLCDFRVTVLDDREQFARADRFPTADQVWAAPLRETLRGWAAGGRLDVDTFIVLVTRGHQQDVDCLLEVLEAPAAYIGMIGSQRRVRAVFQLLSQERGIAPDRFDRIYAPIGLDIGAHTPAEIATCIMAEMIRVLRGRGTGESLSEARSRRSEVGSLKSEIGGRKPEA
jgi:xanthine dehydrogenase accessory factor